MYISKRKRIRNNFSNSIKVIIELQLSFVLYPEFCRNIGTDLTFIEALQNEPHWRALNDVNVFYKYKKTSLMHIVDLLNNSDKHRKKGKKAHYTTQNLLNKFLSGQTRRIFHLLARLSHPTVTLSHSCERFKGSFNFKLTQENRNKSILLFPVYWKKY